MGDPGKLVILESVLKVIEQQNLLDLVNKTGEKLKCGLLEFQNDFPELLNSARGRGTFLAVTAETSDLRDCILKKLKAKGKLFKNVLEIC